MKYASRRDLYRASKKRILRLLRQRLATPRPTLERAVRNYLRTKKRSYLLRVVKHHAFAAAVAAFLAASAPVWAEVPISLANVSNGIGGFLIQGIDERDRTGSNVAILGDINGDGMDDVVVSAWAAEPQGQTGTGQIFVVFGKADGALADLADIEDGTGGFVINGIDDYDYAGRSLARAGDVNGDQLDDIIIGAYAGDPGGRNRAGESFVVFGKSDTEAINLSSVAGGTGGFVINGEAAYDYSGKHVSGAGDVNGDGLADVMVSAYRKDATYGTGITYVVFGKSTGTAVELSDIAEETGGFTINAASLNDYAGESTAPVGDMNNDGYDDVVIGAWAADPTDDGGGAGSSYVIFGKKDGTPVELRDIELGYGGGFAIHGIEQSDNSGRKVSGAGDVNGDGIPDVIVNASLGNPNAYTGGAAYVVFGKSTIEDVLLSDVAEGTGGFPIYGIDNGDFAGDTLAPAGDFNGDGYDDVLLAAAGADHPDVFPRNIGETYIVFGKDDGDTVDLEDVANGTGGIMISGIDSYDQSGQALAGGGDINGDGLLDIVIGAPRASVNDVTDVGEAYVVFNPFPVPVNIGLRDATNDEAIAGGRMFLERTDAPLGIQSSFARVDENGDALFVSPSADIIDWNIVATSGGFLPSDVITLSQDTTGDALASIALALDPELANPNILRVRIDLLDTELSPTGLQLLSKTVQLQVDSIDLGLTPLYGEGEMIFLGVPVGDVEVFVPDTQTFAFTPESVTLGTVEDRRVNITATIVDANPAAPPTRAGGDLPGIIVGTAGNSNAATPTALPNALIISSQEGSDFATFSRADENGVFILPDIVAGLGKIEAFSEDGTIRGTTEAVTVVSGDTYGDDQSEDTDLTVPIPSNDRDFDGLPNDFEDTFLTGVPADQQGPEDDPDEDSLTNFDEFVALTDPTLADTDSDNFLDAAELLLGSDPDDGASRPSALSLVYVDFGHTGPEAGTLANPYSTLQAAADAVEPGGTIRVKGDVGTTTGPDGYALINKDITVIAYRGSVTID